MTLAIASWHEVEHIYLLAKYIQTGISGGSPGLLDRGGAIGGGFPILGPDLHFIYNTIETLPLIGGFLYQLHRTEIPDIQVSSSPVGFVP
jgi:hypothetical protein